MLPLVSHALAGRAEHAIVILYASEPDQPFEFLYRKADRLMFFDCAVVSARNAAQRDYRVPGAGTPATRTPRQRTLGAT
jgi:hypothetical protein